MANCGQACAYNTLNGCTVKKYNAICPLTNVATPAAESRMTNADRIRTMSVEELAEWIVKQTVYQESAFSEPSYLNLLTGSDDTFASAVNGTVKWLKQSAE